MTGDVDWASDEKILLRSTSDVIVPVEVSGAVWSPIVGETLKEMENKKIHTKAQRVIAANLRSLRWTFVPGSFGGSNFTGRKPTSDELLAKSYLYVSLLFARYASLLGKDGTQLLSPSQTESMIAVAAAEAQGSGAHVSDVGLWGPLEPMLTSTRPGFERTWQSTRLYFLPYLLSLVETGSITTPEALFDKAIALRSRGDVKDYRHHYHEVREKMARGEDVSDWRRELDRVKHAVERSLRVEDRVLECQISQSGPSAGSQVNVSGARDWLLGAWPGKRYRRVLVRLAKAQEQSKKIDQTLRPIWNDA